MAARKQTIEKDWFSKAAELKAPKTKTQNLLENKVTTAADLPEILSPKDVARILKMNPKTASALMKAKTIHSAKLGGRRISTPEWVADYIRKEIKKNG